jgi:glutamate 5-kinase
VEIEKILGYADSEYVAHRQHVGFFGKGSRPVSPAQEIISAVME